MKTQGIIARAASVAALLAGVSSAGSAQQPQKSVTASDPEVSVNIRNENRPAERVINFTATPGSYVAVIRVNPLGGVEVLYPASAVVDRAMIPSTKRVPVPKTPTGGNQNLLGSIFAFVSSTPFVFSRVADRNGWNSLHLANYADATDAAIAESFGNEIAAPNSRVIMSKATTAPVAIIGHDHRPLMASLASFRSKTCPSTSFSTTSVKGIPECLSIASVFQTLPQTPVQMGPTPQQSRTGSSK